MDHVIIFDTVLHKEHNVLLIIMKPPHLFQGLVKTWEVEYFLAALSSDVAAPSRVV